MPKGIFAHVQARSLVFVVVFGLSASGAIAAPGPKPTTLTVAAITDFHGELEPTIYKTAAGAPVPVGGALILASYIKTLRSKANGPVLLVDTGDLFQGTLISNTTEGAPVIKFYNYLHVNATAVGNHDFDYGPAGERSYPLPGEDAQGALKNRIAEAHFPFLAANIIDVHGRVPTWLKPSVLLNGAGLKVGIIGIADPDTPLTTSRQNLAGLRFLPPLAIVIREARALRMKGADAVVLLIHAGSTCFGDTVSTSDPCWNSTFMQFLRTVPPGLVDVVLGGHTHAGLGIHVGRMAVMEPFSNSKAIEWATVPLADKNAPIQIAGPVTTCGAMVQSPTGPTCDPAAIAASEKPTQPATFLGTTIVPDAEAAALLAADFERVRAIKMTPLGVTALLPFEKTWNHESALGNLVVDAMRDMVPGSDVGTLNPGGIRKGLPAGALVYGDLFSVLPFDNFIAKVTLSGQQLARIVELGHTTAGLTWSNLTFEANDCKITSIRIGGTPIDLNKQYHMVTNDYLAMGGSAFAQAGLNPSQIQILRDSHFVLRDAVAEGLRRAGPTISPNQVYDPNNPRQKTTGSCHNN